MLNTARPNFLYSTFIIFGSYVLVSEKALESCLIIYCCLFLVDISQITPQIYHDVFIRSILYVISVCHFKNERFLIIAWCCLHKKYFLESYSLWVDVVLYICIFYDSFSTYIFSWILIFGEEDTIHLYHCLMCFYYRSNIDVFQQLFLLIITTFKIGLYLAKDFTVDVAPVLRSFTDVVYNKYKEHKLSIERYRDNILFIYFLMHISFLIICWKYHWLNFITISHVLLLIFVVIDSREEDLYNRWTEQEVQNIQQCVEKINEFSKLTFPVSDDTFNLYVHSKQRNFKAVRRRPQPVSF